jgi:hypothetical protein
MHRFQRSRALRVEGCCRSVNLGDRPRRSLALLLELGWRLGVSFSAAIFVLAVAHGAMADAPKRVLVLHSFGFDFEEDIFSDDLRKDLADKSHVPLEFYEMALDAAHSRGDEHDVAFAEYIKVLLGGRPPDLVVAMLTTAARFAQRQRQNLFPTTPIILAGVAEWNFRNTALDVNDTIVAGSDDLPGVVANILRTLPDTTTIAVIFDNSPHERPYVGLIRQEVQPLQDRVNFIYFDELSLEDMLASAARLPPHTAILLADMRADGSGVQHGPQEILMKLRAVANAPIFGLFVNGGAKDSH